MNPETLTVATFNTKKGQAIRQYGIDHLLGTHPEIDVLGLQEVMPTDADTLEEQAVLHGFDLVRFDGLCRTAGGLAIVVRSGLTDDSSSTRGQSWQISHQSRKDNILPFWCPNRSTPLHIREIAGIMLLKHTMPSVAFLTAHTYPPSGPPGFVLQRGQLKRMAQVIGNVQYHRPGAECIVAGDMNIFGQWVKSHFDDTVLYPNNMTSTQIDRPTYLHERTPWRGKPDIIAHSAGLVSDGTLVIDVAGSDHKTILQRFTQS